MITDEIKRELFRRRDEKYCSFQSRLIPTIDKNTIIGVRTPELRKMAKEMARREDLGEFLEILPHEYFEENQLHGFLVSGIGDYNRCREETCRFLPYVDNWATCDQMSPKVFKKNRPSLLDDIRRWIACGQTYTVRFSIKMLMEHFLEEDFDTAYLEMASGVRSGEYYINMMTAWYFATALAKQYEKTLPFIEERRLDVWTHNKAIQKSVESRRITPGQKAYLKSLKVLAK
ncbi:hypothetical protein IMSAGC019_01608 [Lachnospiraceae bacterium]|nr:hypothetical protein IMSAGC019_01608 [Lachnospiraceae bacterium]